MFSESTWTNASDIFASNFSIVIQEFNLTGSVSKHDFWYKSKVPIQTSFSCSSNLDIYGLIPPVSRSNLGLHFLSNNQTAIFYN